MAHLYKSVAALRIFGDTLNPDEITQILGCNPSMSYVNGQVIPSKTRDIIRKTGMWRLDATSCTPENLDAQVAELLGKLSPDLTVWAALANDYEIDLFCGFFMKTKGEGLDISALTLKSLGDRNIPTGLCLYSSMEDDCDEHTA
ncbi:MAG: DUF4279 domain-containing protein [Undibacterium sp.]|uniref:DUF4279 domain-containing protein n=1 Tax=Undibacterium sp. TaxID=1914977 RepID=UPI002720125F|nr:DUF4279 domain-containing protein [Undibacterium sp.]MDO8652606.1 DUF4279 domain-containing protein [Undibacterium sp.]